MYEIIATDEFVNVICELPLKYIGVLTNSFTSIKKLNEKDYEMSGDKSLFMLDLLEQMRNQEID